MPRLTGFPRLFAAATVSNLGDGLRRTAVPLLAASLTRDPSAIAAVTAVLWLPWLVFGVLGRALLGRVSGTFRVFSYGSIPIGAMFGGWLAASFGLRPPFLVGGAVVAIAGVLIGTWVTQAAIDRARQAARPVVD